MSNDEPTQELPNAESYITQPGVTEILKRISALDEKVTTGFEQVHSTLQQFENRLNRIDGRLDRTESMVLEMRADLRDLRDALKEHILQLR